MFPEDISIRRVESGDAPLLELIAPDVFDEDLRPDALAAFLAAEGHALFVAIADGVVVGQARGMIHVQPDKAKELYVDNLGVAPSHQRRGIATRLVRSLMDWGRAGGCASLWVATEIDNAEGIAFYASLGLEPKTLVWFSSDLGLT
jgi:aminoglycoside 6'-N-acetyltransferase I